MVLPRVTMSVTLVTPEMTMMVMTSLQLSLSDILYTPAPIINPGIEEG